MYCWALFDLKWFEIGARFFQQYLLKGTGLWLRQKGLGWIWGRTKWCWDDTGWQDNLQRIITAWKQSNCSWKILGYVHKSHAPVDFVKDELDGTISSIMFTHLFVRWVWELSFSLSLAEASLSIAEALQQALPICLCGEHQSPKLCFCGQFSWT